MIIAITGANGYLGKNLTEYFVRQGHQVIKLIRKPEKIDERKFVLGEELIDIPFDKVDLLVHTAFDFVANRDYKKSYQVNVLGSKKLFEKAIKSQVKVLVYISSISAFDGCKSLYGQIKITTENELLGLNYGNTYIFRPGLIWGHNLGGMMQSLSKISQLKIVPMVGANIIQYMSNYEDIAQAILFVVTTSQNQKLITIASTKTYYFAEIIKLLGAKVVINIPWKLIYLVIKFCEKIGLHPRTGSDSLISLVNQNNHINLDNKLFNWKFKDFR